MLEGDLRDPDDPGGSKCGEMQGLARVVRDAIEVEAKDALERDRATLELTHESDEQVVRLKPRNVAAASLEVNIDTERLVTCFAGRDGGGLPLEIYSSAPADIAAGVRGLARAVIAGQYSERVRDTDTKSKIVAEWPEDGKRRRARYNVLRNPRPDDPNWRTVVHEPY